MKKLLFLIFSIFGLQSSAHNPLSFGPNPDEINLVKSDLDQFDLLLDRFVLLRAIIDGQATLNIRIYNFASIESAATSIKDFKKYDKLKLNLEIDLKNINIAQTIKFLEETIKPISDRVLSLTICNGADRDDYIENKQFIFKTIFETIIKFINLNSLSLVNNGIDDDFASELSNRLCFYGLDKIDLAYNNITSKGLKVIFKNIGRSNISVLRLENNDFGDNGGQIIRDNIVNRPIKTLYVGQCGISENMQQQIIDQIKSKNSNVSVNFDQLFIVYDV